jgi:hypothetical protein
MYKNATKCNETVGKWCKNKHGASKIIDTFETYQGRAPSVVGGITIRVTITITIGRRIRPIIVASKIVPDTGWPSDTTASCASTLESDIIEAWKRRKKKIHQKEAWKRYKKRRHLKLDRLKPVPHQLKLTPPAKAGLNTGYSWSTRVNSALAMKPPMLSISLVTKLPLAHGCRYIWPPDTSPMYP